MKKYLSLFIVSFFLSAKEIIQAQIVFQKTYGVGQGQALQQTNDKGFIIIGNAYGSAGSGYAINSVVKTDSLGVISWSRSLSSGSNNQLLGYAVEETSDGGVYY